MIPLSEREPPPLLPSSTAVKGEGGSSNNGNMISGGGDTKNELLDRLNEVANENLYSRQFIPENMNGSEEEWSDE